MIIKNVKIYGGANAVNIFVEGRTISGIGDFHISESDPVLNEPVLAFDGAKAFPGLINSHDHLEFNLFPRFGNRIFDNYLAWSNYTSKKYKAEIDSVLQIPLRLRILWGIYKNLLCGITTVVHHGKKIEIDKPEIEVFQHYQFLHSVGLEKSWKYKLNNPFSSRQVVVHIGEGKDEYAKREIDELIYWNFLKKEIVGVHGVAMNELQAKSFKALVWCPGSNAFMLDETAKIDKLKEFTQIVFGTDSTLTADWNLWKHLRLAKENSGVSDQELFEMLTTVPAKIWGMQNLGAIKEDYRADIVIAEDNSTRHSLFDINPENILLILKNGEIKLIDEKISNQLSWENGGWNDYSPVSVNGRKKYVHGNLPGLVAEVRKYDEDAPFPIEVI